MGKPILWPAERVETNENNRLVTDTQIEEWNNKLENINVTDWNNAIESGFYNADKSASNAPNSSVPLSGTVITSGNLIIQQLYPEDTSTEELVYYVRKGFKSGDSIVWSKWFIINLLMEEELTYTLKYSKRLFNQLIPSTVTSIYFTDIKMPSDATLIDVDEDGDGGVVAWVDTIDNTKMYVSTQKEGVKVEANSDSDELFSFCTNLTFIDLSNFDTSNVTNMLGFFANCKKITSLDLSNFDTSKVTNMSQMFPGIRCALDLSNFDTSNVTDMSSMFLRYTSTSLDLSNFDTSNVTDMDMMFTNCINLTTIKVGDKFKWVGTLRYVGLYDDNNSKDQIWQDEEGNTYTSSDTFPSNVAHTYTKVS